MSDTLSQTPEQELGALDAYSQVVVSVAEQLTPRVAALEVSHRQRDGSYANGAGSAVVFTNDGFLLTNAHVVGSAEAGRVEPSRHRLEIHELPITRWPIVAHSIEWAKTRNDEQSRRDLRLARRARLLLLQAAR